MSYQHRLQNNDVCYAQEVKVKNGKFGQELETLKNDIANLTGKKI